MDGGRFADLIVCTRPAHSLPFLPVSHVVSSFDPQSRCKVSHFLFPSPFSAMAAQSRCIFNLVSSVFTVYSMTHCIIHSQAKSCDVITFSFLDKFCFPWSSYESNLFFVCLVFYVFVTKTTPSSLVVWMFFQEIWSFLSDYDTVFLLIASG